MNSKPQNFTDDIMAKLEKEQVVPRSRLWFVARNYALWLVWFLSILVGAVTLSVLWYSVQNGWYGFYEATHESWLDFMFDTISFVWLPIFAVLIALAYFDMRYTRLGYRYPFWKIIGSSLIFSLIGSVVSVSLGIGSMVDKGFGEFMPQYPSQLAKERGLWQAPASGRLAGLITERDGAIVVTDMNGKEWSLVTEGISGMDVDMLTAGMHVRLLGIASSSSFHICGVLPGMENKNMPPEKMVPYHLVVRERIRQLRESIDMDDRDIIPCLKMFREFQILQN